MARPMVVGDRLWLFSQTPNETPPVQNILLNNTQPVIPSYHSNIRPAAINGILDITRNALISRGQAFTNYGYNYNSPSYINGKTENTMQHQPYIDGSYYKTMMRPKIQMAYEHNKNNLVNKSNYNTFYQADPNNYIQTKYSQQLDNFSPIINLERAFGSHNESLIPSSHEINDCKDVDICDNDSSDIDCEAIEENKKSQ